MDYERYVMTLEKFSSGSKILVLFGLPVVLPFQLQFNRIFEITELFNSGGWFRTILSVKAAQDFYGC